MTLFRSGLLVAEVIWYDPVAWAFVFTSLAVGACLLGIVVVALAWAWDRLTS